MSVNNVITFSAYKSDQNIFFEMTTFAGNQWETISLVKFQPRHGAVDFLGNLGVFRWEIQNYLDSLFYFRVANLLLKQKKTLIWLRAILTCCTYDLCLGGGGLYDIFL